MFRILLTGAVVTALAIPASAYDALYSNETASPPGRGSVRLEVSLLYLSAEDIYGADGTTLPLESDWNATWVPVRLSYAITDRISVGANARYGSLSLEGVETEESVRSSRATDDFEGSGFGDLWLWGKLNVLPRPLVTIRAGLKIPTGAEPADRAHALADTGSFLDGDGDLALGDGQTDIDIAALLSFPRDSGAFELSIGYRFRMSQSFELTDGTYDLTPGNEIRFAAGYAYRLNQAMILRLGLDGFAGSDDSADTDCEQDTHPAGDIGELLEGSARNAVWINPSFDYEMRNGLLFGFDMHYPLMGQNIPAEWGVELRVGWTR
jgi:hypothetical protein